MVEFVDLFQLGYFIVRVEICPIAGDAGQQNRTGRRRRHNVKAGKPPVAEQGAFFTGASAHEVKRKHAHRTQSFDPGIKSGNEPGL